MRIAIDLTALADHLSGIERFALCVARELIPRLPPEDTFVLIFKGGIHPSFLDLCGRANVKTRIIPSAGKLLASQVLLPIAFYKIRADFYLFLAFPAPLLFISRRSVSAIHDLCCWDCPETMKAQSRVLFRTLLQKSALADRFIVTVSEFSKERIIDKLNVKPEKILRVYDGVDERFAAKAERNEDDIGDIRRKYSIPGEYILCLSTLEPRKNLRLLVSAYLRLARERPDLSDLVLVGRKGWLTDDLLRRADERYAHKIRVTGFVADADLPAIYRNARLFVFPSSYEGFGLPPLEALAAGCEVLTSDAASMPEVLGAAVHYFRSGDELDLADRLRKLLDGEIPFIPDEAKKAAVGQYKWSEQADILIARLRAEYGRGMSVSQWKNA